MTPRRRLVYGAVHRFAEGINGVHRFAAGFRQKQKRVIKVTAAFLRVGRAIQLRFSGRHDRRPFAKAAPSSFCTLAWSSGPVLSQLSTVASNSTPSTRRGPGRLK